MSPYHYCKICDQEVIGESKFGCMICNKIQINKEINYKKYFNGLLGVNLPIEIISYIAHIGSNNINYILINDINEKCWKARMHGLINRPHMLSKLFKSY